MEVINGAIKHISKRNPNFGLNPNQCQKTLIWTKCANTKLIGVLEWFNGVLVYMYCVLHANTCIESYEEQNPKSQRMHANLKRTKP